MGRRDYPGTELSRRGPSQAEALTKTSFRLSLLDPRKSTRHSVATLQQRIYVSIRRASRTATEYRGVRSGSSALHLARGQRGQESRNGWIPGIFKRSSRTSPRRRPTSLCSTRSVYRDERGEFIQIVTERTDGFRRVLKSRSQSVVNESDEIRGDDWPIRSYGDAIEALRQYPEIESS